MNNFNLDESSLPPLATAVGGGVERFGVVGREFSGVVLTDGLPDEVAAEAMLTGFWLGFTAVRWG